VKRPVTRTVLPPSWLAPGLRDLPKGPRGPIRFPSPLPASVSRALRVFGLFGAWAKVDLSQADLSRRWRATSAYSPYRSLRESPLADVFAERLEAPRFPLCPTAYPNARDEFSIEPFRTQARLRRDPQPLVPPSGFDYPLGGNMPAGS